MAFNEHSSIAQIDLNNSILFNCRLFFAENSSLNAIVEILYHELPFQHKDYLKELKILALNNILCNIILASDSGKFLAVSRSKNYYTIPKMYGLLHFTYSFVVPLIDALENSRYIKVFPGYFDNKSNTGKRTRVIATDKLLNLFIIPLSYKYLPYGTPVILKDRDKKFLAYHPDKSIKKMKLILDRYNDFISSNKIVFGVKKIGHKNIPLTANSSTCKYVDNSFYYSTKDKCIRYYYTDAPTSSGASVAFHAHSLSLYQPIFISIPLLIPSDNKSLHYKELHCEMYRVFNNSSFILGGRYYGADYQLFNSSDRSRIIINGNKTTEVDFTGLHISMLYNMIGLNIQTDPYAISGGPSELRVFPKIASMVLVNAKNKKSAISAMHKAIRDDNELLHLKKKYKVSVIKLFAAFEKHHQTISKFFGSGIGLSLQNTDSKIAEDILDYFTSREIPCLCVHDSFLVEEKHRDELTSVMKDTYIKHLGFPGKIKIIF